jgi:hypothetical protein
MFGHIQTSIIEVTPRDNQLQKLVIFFFLEKSICCHLYMSCRPHSLAGFGYHFWHVRSLRSTASLQWGGPSRVKGLHGPPYHPCGLGGLEETESTSCYTLATSPSQLIKNVRWEDAGTTGLGRLSPGRLMFLRLLHFTLNTIAACSWSSPKHGSPTVHCSKNHSIQPLIATRWSSIHKLIYRLICLLIVSRPSVSWHR